MHALTRRTVALGALALPAIGKLTFAAESAIRRRPAAHTDAGHEMLRRYGVAVATMKALPRYHPHSWHFQASIHWKPVDGSDLSEPKDEDIFNALELRGASAEQLQQFRQLALGSPDGQFLAMWRSCHHHDDDFLPWHRLQLRAFESIAALYAGPSKSGPFALPYWDYTSDAVLPREFRVGSEIVWQGANPLMDITRRLGFNNQSWPTALDGLDWNSPMNASVLAGDDNSFRKLIEAQHDQVHMSLGQRNGMANPAYAARDPIFWLHHATIDWLWESWRQATPSPDPTDTEWLGKRYAFAGPKLEYQEVAVGTAFQDTLRLGYAYDGIKSMPPDRVLIPPRPPRPFADIPVIAESRSDGPALVIGDREAAARLTVKPQAPRPFSGGAQERLFLEFSNIRASGEPQGIYRVFLNRPANVSGAGLRAFQAGAFTFFSRHAEHGEPFDVRFDVTRIVTSAEMLGGGGPVVSVDRIRGDDDAQVEVAKVRLIAL